MENENKGKITSWVNEVFQYKKYDKIIINFPDYDTRGGYAGDVVFIDVTGEKNGNHEKFELIIKKNKENNSQALEKMNMSLVYLQEIKFYSKFIPFMNDFAKNRKATPFENVPWCYGTINRKNEYVIIMENLKTKGFKTHELESPFDIIHTKLVLEAYANLHAFSFAFRDQNCSEIFKNFENTNKEFLESALCNLFVSTVRKELDFVINMYKEKRRFQYIKNLEKLKDDFDDIYKNSLIAKDEKYLVLRHGDCWNNNYLFHYDYTTSPPDKAIIIDWQIGLITSPLLDLSHFLFYCCTSPVLQHLDELLEFYYEKLSMKLLELGSNPEKCFPKEDFQASFKKYASFGIAGMPMAVKMSCKEESDNTYDISQAIEDGNFNNIFDTGLRDPEEYFSRVDGILKICIERNFI